MVGVGLSAGEFATRQLDVATGDVVVGSAITLGGVSGIISATKFSGGWSGSLSIDDSTTSTSETTGALIITGGVGIAKSLFVGEGISVGGTITYDDVTNIDSVGFVTAGKGLRATTGGIIVSAGVGTFKADVELHGNQGVSSVTWDSSANSLIFKDRSEVKFGSGNDLRIMHDGTNPYMDQLGSPQGAFYIRNNDAQFIFQAKMDENSLILKPDGAVELYHDNSKKLETTADGVTITGALTSPVKVGAGLTLSSDFINLTDNSKLQLGIASDLSMWHNGSHSYIQNTTGTLYIRSKADETAMSINPDGGVDLRYDGTKTIETIGTGVSVYGALKLQNGLLRENVNRNTSAAANAATALDLDNGMVHWFTTNLGAANVKMNVVSGVGINTDLAIGDMISVTIMTAVNSTGNFIEQLRVDGVEASAGVTTYWAGGSAPTDGGGTGVDTYAFNILKTGNGTYDMIANQVKGS